jgi:mannose-6-phosphate isomerase-like protein (cupin superfamily)
VLIQSLDDAEPFECAGIQFRMVLSRNHTSSAEVVWERLEPGDATPSDQHAHFDQIFFFLKGAAEVTVGSDRSIVKPQDTVFIPRTVLHSVSADKSEGVEYLYINVWGKPIPESERDWRTVYSQIHERRTAVR